MMLHITSPSRKNNIVMLVHVHIRINIFLWIWLSLAPIPISGMFGCYLGQLVATTSPFASLIYEEDGSSSLLKTKLSYPPRSVLWIMTRQTSSSVGWTPGSQVMRWVSAKPKRTMLAHFQSIGPIIFILTGITTTCNSPCLPILHIIQDLQQPVVINLCHWLKFGGF